MNENEAKVVFERIKLAIKLPKDMQLLELTYKSGYWWSIWIGEHLDNSNIANNGVVLVIDAIKGELIFYILEKFH